MTLPQIKPRLHQHLVWFFLTLRVGKLASKARAAAEAITSSGINHQEATEGKTTHEFLLSI